VSSLVVWNTNILSWTVLSISIEFDLRSSLSLFWQLQDRHISRIIKYIGVFDNTSLLWGLANKCALWLLSLLKLDDVLVVLQVFHWRGHRRRRRIWRRRSWSFAWVVKACQFGSRLCQEIRALCLLKLFLKPSMFISIFFKISLVLDKTSLIFFESFIFLDIFLLSSSIIFSRFL